MEIEHNSDMKETKRFHSISILHLTQTSLLNRNLIKFFMCFSIYFSL